VVKIPEEALLSDETAAERFLRVGGRRVPTAADGRFSAKVALAAGQNSISLLAVGLADSVLDRKVVNVVRDDAPPELFLTEPAEGLHTPEPMIAVRGICRDATIDRLVVADTIVTPGADGSFEFRVALNREGDTTIRAMGRDRAGNVTEVSRSVRHDSIRPSISLDGPADGSCLNRNPVCVAGLVRESNLDRLRIAGRDVPFQSDGMFTADVRLAGEGRHTLKVEAVDRAGLSESVTLTIVLDLTPPELTIKTPLEGASGPDDRIVVSGGAAVDARFVGPSRPLGPRRRSGVRHGDLRPDSGDVLPVRAFRGEMTRSRAARWRKTEPPPPAHRLMSA
jgi:hypothetical protein